MMSCSTMRISVSNNAEMWDKNKGLTGLCFKEFEFITWFGTKQVLPISHPYFVFGNDWRTVQIGRYYNGIGKYGSAGSYVEFKLKQSVKEFAILGDKWHGTGSNVASVWINGERVSGFTPDLLSAQTYPKLYQRVLFVMKKINADSDYTVKIQVESGEIGLAGLLLQEAQFDGAMVQLGPTAMADVQQSSPNDVKLAAPSEAASTASFSLGAVTVMVLAVSCCVVAVIVGASYLFKRYSARPTQN